jgi:hypothetical protein
VPALREQLLGAWTLVEYVARAADGTRVHPLGPDAAGLLVYTDSGHMAAQLMAAGRPRWPRDGDPDRLDRLAAIATGYLAYAGPFVVDEAAGTVAHHVELSLLPNWVGGEQLRVVALDGDVLDLSVAGPAPGDPPTHRLRWRRLRPAAA